MPKCSRTACRARNANQKHSHTGRPYCLECARRINDACEEIIVVPAFTYDAYRCKHCGLGHVQHSLGTTCADGHEAVVNLDAVELELHRVRGLSARNSSRWSLVKYSDGPDDVRLELEQRDLELGERIEELESFLTDEEGRANDECNVSVPQE